MTVPPLSAPCWHFPLTGTPLNCPQDTLEGPPEGHVWVPTGPHPGAFGAWRRHHRHEGVDLYAAEGTEVRTVEEGRVVAIAPFTGTAEGSPWWLDTQAVWVEGRSGVVLYGEVQPPHLLQVGVWLATGASVGTVLRVLRHAKGRPTSMLHLELHTRGTRTAFTWALNSERPDSLRDPTDFLLEADGSAPFTQDPCFSNR